MAHPAAQFGAISGGQLVGLLGNGSRMAISLHRVA